ncbi:hypothetical protein DMC47_14100 [Nostoc sp. 3335mG]|nr:hypothetical protein DMC47_14100 [Nostoc sp. 3335mG]
MGNWCRSTTSVAPRTCARLSVPRDRVRPCSRRAPLPSCSARKSSGHKGPFRASIVSGGRTIRPPFSFSAPPISGPACHESLSPMSDTPKPETADRLAKVMARAGLCSRRDAEAWIAAGRVSVNGKKVITPAFNVTSRDKIIVDGKPLAERQGTRVWLYHKPAGLVVTEKDPEGRATIFEALEEQGLPRVVTVGRLDINTEGLLLLTNDGGLKRVLELPSTGWLRRYRVRAYGQVTQAQLDALKTGITVDGVNYGPIEATLEREQGSNVWIVVGLREGKNREVKNVLGALGLEVNRLIRVSYGPFQLGDLKEGEIEVVKAKMLKDQLGKKLAEAAGVDFDSEMPDGGLFPPPRAMSESPRSRGFRKPASRSGFGDREEERPIRPRRVHFDEDGRAPEDYEPKGAGKPRLDKEDQPARSFGRGAPRSERGDRPERSDRPARGDRPSGDRKQFGGKKSFGDRKPYGGKNVGDRPQRSRRNDGDERPARSFEDRPQRRDEDRRGGGDRAQRSFGDRPSRGSGDRPQRGAARPFVDKPGRSFGDRPARGGSERPARPYGDRPARPFGDKPARGGQRPDRPQRGFEEGRPQRRDDRPGQGRPQGGRPGGKSFGDRSSGGRPEGGRPSGGRPSGGRPSGGKPFAGKPGGGRPTGGRPSGPRKPRG